MCSDNTTIPYVSLFSGYEGIGIALERIFGEALRTIAYCERSAFACENLVDKIEKGKLDAAPIFTDVHTFPWKEYAPFMANGIMSFGFPCTPVSLAGKRKVTEDERWLFDICADGIEILRPGTLFAENVEGLLSAEMPNGKPVVIHILERLEGLGYKVEVGLFSASEVSAPHQRKRVFILAHSERSGTGKLLADSPNRNGSDKQIREEDKISVTRSGKETMGYSESYRNTEFRSSHKREDSSGKDRSIIFNESSSNELGNSKSNDKRRSSITTMHGERVKIGGSSSDELENSKRQFNRSKTTGHEIIRKNTQRSANRASGSSDLWPARPGQPQYEWEEPRVLANTGSKKQQRISQSEGWNEDSEVGKSSGEGNFEPLMGRAVARGSSGLDPNRNRSERLRLLGNGVVPATAEKAFITLHEKLTKKVQNIQLSF